MRKHFRYKECADYEAYDEVDDIINDEADDESYDYDEEGLTDGEFSYTLNDNGEAVAVGYHGSGDTVTVPEKLGLRKVTEIGSGNFLKHIRYKNEGMYMPRLGGAKEAIRVILPDSIKKIGEYAFYGSGLAEITLPEGLEEIGEFAFGSCENLTEIRLPESLKVLEDGALQSCGSLKSIRLPANLKKMGNAALGNCEALESMELSAENEYFKLIDGVLFTKSGDKLVCYPAGRDDDEYIVPEGVVIIGGGAFLGCVNIETIKMPPEGVVEIMAEAFEGCDMLTNIILPDSLEVIREDAFGNCGRLHSVYLPKNVQVFKNAAVERYCFDIKVAKDNEFLRARNGLLYTKKGKRLLMYYGNDAERICTVPDGIRVIGENAFRNADELERVILPDSVRSIKTDAFSWCRGLKRINLPAGITDIGRRAFLGCNNLIARVKHRSYAQKYCVRQDIPCNRFSAFIRSVNRRLRR